MRRLFTCLCMLAVLSVLDAYAQEIVWHDMSDYPVYGKLVDSTATRYSRFPAHMEAGVRESLWHLAKDTPGQYLRFRTDSKVIKVRWTHTLKASMRHMTDIGTRGLDIYMQDEGQWWFAGAAFPGNEKQSSATIASSLDGTMHECMLYLSLYDGLEGLEVGIEEGARLLPAELNSPRQELKPIIMYGTSITQGGCANRPGMAFTNIMARRLNRNVINMGFSGNARLDIPIAEYMASYPDPAIYVLDNIANCTPDMITERTADFVKVLRKAHPDTPIVLIEGQQYANWHFHTKNATQLPESNRRLKAEYNKLRDAGDKHIYYIDNKNLIGTDCEATVDGTHLTDLGMLRFADKVTPILARILRKEKVDR